MKYQVCIEAHIFIDVEAENESEAEENILKEFIGLQQQARASDIHVKALPIKK